MTSSRFERMVAIPEDEYMHLKSLQQVYNPLQNKFQTLSNDYNKQEAISDPYVRNLRQGDILNSMMQIKDNIRQQLVQVTPKPYQSRADNLFNFINKKLTVNEKGEIADNDGKVIEGSNIADLIQHAVRDRRRNITPAGWKAFKDILKSSNAPRMILNYETLEEMQQDEESPLTVTPKAAHVESPLTVTPKAAAIPRAASLTLSSRLPTKRKAESSSSTEGAKVARRNSLPLTKRESRIPKYLDDYVGLPNYLKKKKAEGKSSAASKK